MNVFTDGVSAILSILGYLPPPIIFGVSFASFVFILRIIADFGSVIS